jgi:hypothetical protein
MVYIILIFRYRDWGVLLHLVRVRVIPEAVRKIIEAARYSVEDVRVLVGAVIDIVEG